MAARYPWWRAFTPRKSTPSPDTQQEPVGEKTSTSAAPCTDSQAKQGAFRQEVYEETEFEPAFNEQTCRRNLKISRSGRFKEKRRVRASIPRSNSFSDGSVAVAV